MNGMKIRNINRLNNEDGSVLVIALLMLAFLSILGVSATTTSTIEVQIAGNDRNFKQNFYKAEAGAIALLRADGILLMVQGGHPTLGAWTLRQALIDRNDLTSVLKYQSQPFLYPEMEWEMKGFVGRTTVANGLVYFKGQWLLYYGAADRVIGVATCTNED